MVPAGMWSLSRAPFSYLANKVPQTKRFVGHFNEHYQAYPSGFAICTHDAVMAWKKAVQTANSAAREEVGAALKGLTFEGLRVPSLIRALDGQMNCPTYFGRTVYQPGFPVPIMEPLIEIPASKTWPPEQEVLSAREKAARP